MRAANVPHRSNRAVITPTGLDIHRYICNCWFAPDTFSVSDATARQRPLTYLPFDFGSSARIS